MEGRGRERERDGEEKEGCGWRRRRSSHNEESAGWRVRMKPLIAIIWCESRAAECIKGQLSAALTTNRIDHRQESTVRSFKCCVNLLCAEARCVVMRRELQQSGHVCRAATLLALQHTHLTAPEMLTLHRYMRSKVNIYPSNISEVRLRQWCLQSPRKQKYNHTIFHAALHFKLCTCKVINYC